MKSKGWPQPLWDENVPDFNYPTPNKEMLADLMAVTQKKLYLQMEGMSFNVNASARNMAKLAAFMANKGSFDGKQMISEDAWQKMHDNPTELLMDGSMPTNFSQGGVNFYQFDGPEEEWGRNNQNGFVGWVGAGGSVLQWHPELKIGFGYNPYTHNHMENARRGGRLQAVVKQCIQGTYIEYPVP